MNKYLHPYLKAYFCHNNGYNFVALVDSDDKAFFIHESGFNEYLSYEVAKDADYSNYYDCSTAEECAFAIGGELDKFVYNWGEMSDKCEVKEFDLLIK